MVAFATLHCGLRLLGGHPTASQPTSWALEAGARDRIEKIKIVGRVEGTILRII
jgi:hypothetical protein